MKALAVALTLALAAAAQPFGSPTCSGADREPADRRFFFVCYSPSAKVPVWVGYSLTPAQLDRSAPRPSRFRQDHELAGARATDRDYRYSGFARGHLAPAADFAWSEESIRATFLLSNAVPQQQSVNAGRWAQVEAAVRRLARCGVRIHVFTGVLFEGPIERIGAGQVAVPSHIYKVVLAEESGRKTMYAVIVPNRELAGEPLESFAVTVDEVEGRSGLDFFSELDDDQERDLESRVGNLSGAGQPGRCPTVQPDIVQPTR